MPPLTVLLLRLLHGRVGSTLLMQLLASSPDVVCDGIPPCERRVFAYLAGRAEGPELARLWRLFSETARRDRRPGTPRYYAEKMQGEFRPLIDAGIPFRVIDVVRDPRDIYVSARAFAGRLGRDSFGLRIAEPERVNIPLFLCDIAARLEPIGTPVEGVEPILVRYEDMVEDLQGLAAVLSQSLGVTLDAGSVLARADAQRAHMTAASVSASSGRWRRELTPSTANLLTHMLAEPLRRLGYPRS